MREIRYFSVCGSVVFSEEATVALAILVNSSSPVSSITSFRNHALRQFSKRGS